MIELRCTNIRIKGGHRVVCNALLARVSPDAARVLDDKRIVAVYCLKCRAFVPLTAPPEGRSLGGVSHGPRDQVAG